jgi:hypothetical protein
MVYPDFGCESRGSVSGAKLNVRGERQWVGAVAAKDGRRPGRQMLRPPRAVNKARKQAGLEPIPCQTLPLRRRVVRPFGPSRALIGVDGGNNSVISKPVGQGETARNVLGAIDTADQAIGSEIRAILQEAGQPCLVVMLAVDRPRHPVTHKR